MPRPLTFRDFALRLQLFILPSSTVRSILRSILRSPRGRKRTKLVDDIMTGTYCTNEELRIEKNGGGMS